MTFDGKLKSWSVSNTKCALSKCNHTYQIFFFKSVTQARSRANLNLKRLYGGVIRLEQHFLQLNDRTLLMIVVTFKRKARTLHEQNSQPFHGDPDSSWWLLCARLRRGMLFPSNTTKIVCYQERMRYCRASTHSEIRWQYNSREKIFTNHVTKQFTVPK